MKILENSKLFFKASIITLVAILLSVISFLFFYTSNTNLFSNITITGTDNLEVLIKTPLNQKIKLIAKEDTIKLEQRPLKSLIVIHNGIETELFSIQSIDSYNRDNSKISFTFVDQSKSILNIFNWYWKTHSYIQVFIFCCLFLVIAIAVIISWFILIKYCIKKRVGFKIKNRFFKFLLKNVSIKNIAEPLKLTTFNKYFLILLSILILPVIYMHLDRPYSYSAEEKKRALVALEMKMQNNYLEPTLAGEQYYNKPPVFNWFLVPFMSAKKVEAATRSVSVSFLVICAVVLFFLIKKDENWEYALLTSFLFLSSVYVLLYFSLFLYIDGLFTLLLILIFYLNFRMINNGRYMIAFIVTYSLCAIAFITKGVPALWFSAVSLSTALLVNRDFKKIISYQHLIGILVFIVICGAYFFAYTGSSVSFIKNLFEQSARGTESTFYEIIWHIFSFPGRNIIFYAPIGLLFPIIFYKKNLIAIIKNKRLAYFFINIVFGTSIFLSSSDYSQYYILMYIPLIIEIVLHTVKSFLYFTKKELILFIILILVLLLPSSVYFLSSFDDAILIFTIVLTILIIISLVVFRSKIVLILLFSCLIIMVFRVFENKFENSLIFKENSVMIDTKIACAQIAKKYPSNKYFLYTTENPINTVSIFYLSYYSERIVLFSDKCSDFNNSLIIMDKASIPDGKIILDSIPQMSKRGSVWCSNPLYILKFDESLISFKCDKNDEIRCLF